LIRNGYRPAELNRLGYREVKELIDAFLKKDVDERQAAQASAIAAEFEERGARYPPKRADRARDTNKSTEQWAVELQRNAGRDRTT
jgi:hypothetical protein